MTGEALRGGRQARAPGAVRGGDITGVAFIVERQIDTVAL